MGGWQEQGIEKIWQFMGKKKVKTVIKWGYSSTEALTQEQPPIKFECLLMADDESQSCLFMVVW